MWSGEDPLAVDRADLRQARANCDQEIDASGHSTKPMQFAGTSVDQAIGILTTLLPSVPYQDYGCRFAGCTSLANSRQESSRWKAAVSFAALSPCKAVEAAILERKLFGLWASSCSWSLNLGPKMLSRQTRPPKSPRRSAHRSLAVSQPTSSHPASTATRAPVESCWTTSASRARAALCDNSFQRSASLLAGLCGATHLGIGYPLQHCQCRRLRNHRSRPACASPLHSRAFLLYQGPCPHALLEQTPNLLFQ